MRLRSVELEMPDRAAAAAFLQNPWGLLDAGTRGNTTYLRDVPRTLEHVRRNLTKYPRFARLLELLAAHIGELR